MNYLLTDFWTTGTIAELCIFLGGIVCLWASVYWYKRLRDRKKSQSSSFEDLQDHNHKYKIFNLYMAIFLIFASCLMILMSFGFFIGELINLF
ncbi:hypothetical protein [Spiroplasma endosymbiont of Amphibalanus improvisus]|uniref:hypothetical protein n=1 Tax=Spiroplasma endosymbiont of Amphibalanus improvisus TaxID=3066327 RepID=UPI00313DA26E